MKAAFACLCLALFANVGVAVDSDPLGKVFELINALEAKIKAEGEAEAAAFKEFFNWCDSTSTNLNNEIKTGKATQEKLEAKIGELTAAIDVSDSKIEDLSASISKSDGELSEATSIREKEAADFAASEKELVETVDTLDRALSIISTEMAKNPAALAQVDSTSMTSLVKTMSTLVDAASFTSNDRSKLLALAQSKESDEEDLLGAPAGSVYKSHSTGIVDLLEDLKEKAEAELAEARKAESTAKHNYEMMKQSLEDQISADTKDLTEEKASKAASDEEKSASEGDLSVTINTLKTGTDSLAETNSNCMTTAADHEATVAARTEELKVIAEAEKILKDTTSGASSQTYSLLQVVARSKLQTRTDLVNSEVVALVKKLARDQHSAALNQLASRISAVVKYGGRDGADPFSKIKGLISDMISKLEAEAESEATEKAYCDEQLAKTEAKKQELDTTIAKLTSKIDKAAAKSADLKEQVKELQKELSELAASQAEMDKIRMEEHSAYSTAKADLELGLSGVRKALSVLTEYYGSAAALVQEGGSLGSQMAQPAVPTHSKAGGAGGSIINILQVCESDFATNLAKEESAESDAAELYEKTTQENKITKTTKDQDVKYKTAEAVSLDKEISELSSDKDSTSTELAAVMEYYGQIKERCIAKPETYEERKARREAEIAGLKDALSILENEAAFVQRKHRMRGSRFAAALQ